MGRPLDLEGTPTYVSSQPGYVLVSADGLVKAIAPRTNVYVIASLVAGNVRHVDTTVVNVTAVASPPTVAFFSVQPVAPDSTRWAIHQDPIGLIPGFVKQPPLRIQAAGGTPITGVAVRYTSSDPVLAPIHSFNGEIKSKRTGRVTFTAEATIYGTTWRDSVEYEFDWPAMGWAQVFSSAKAGEPPILYAAVPVIRIGKGGTVAFTNAVDIPVGIVFDDPTHVAATTSLQCPPAAGLLPQTGSGDIPPFGGGPLNLLKNCQSRRFPVPGVYTYRSTPAGATGTIIVEETAP